MLWPDPTHQPTHLPTHQTIHPPMGGKFSTDFKSLSGFESVIEFLLILGVPGGWWMGGLGWICVWVCGGVPCMHACMHTCTCMLNMINMDASMLVAICNFYTCVCVHVHACGDTYHVSRCPQTPPPTCSLPRATGSPKHQNSISPELIKIIQFCLKILYLWMLLNSYRL